MEINILKMLNFFRKDIFEERFFKNITVVATILWGWLQVLNLIAISPAYLRFFSVTQMLSDSIMLVCTIILIFLPIKLLFFLSSMGGKESMLDTVREITIFWLILFWSILIFDWLNKFKETQYLFRLNSISDLILVIFYGIVLFSMIAYLLITNKNIIKTFEYFINYEIARALLTCFLITIVLWSPVFISIKIRQLLLLPEDFKNLSYICWNEAEETCKVLFFNDKYIFVKRGIDKIEILKFEDFFIKK